LRARWRPIVEASAAATIAWVVATRVLGHPQPFFAPASALIVLAQARGQRMLRAVEVVLGVAGGVLVADVVAQALGPHTTLTILTVIVSTLTIAAAIGASNVFLVQASVSALYVAVVTPPTHSVIPFRFVDALVGGGIALVASQLGRPRNPLAPLIQQSRHLFDEVAGVLEETAGALQRRDQDAALAALDRARHADEAVDELRSAVSAAREALLFDVRRRQRLSRVTTIESAISQVDYAVRTTRVLSRAVVNLTRLPAAPPPELVTAIQLLASAVREVERALAAELAGDADAVGRHAARAEETVLQAVRTGAHLLPDGQSLPVLVIVGQLRNAAIDLLRAIGADDMGSLSRVDSALGLPPA
jgi:uncharacterized membrane protein YgaE (UPF0421/DUF939 family)